MKNIYQILIIVVFNIITCFGAGQLELSSRTGKIITIETRDYFGLFPKINQFHTAVLFEENDSKYFLITTKTNIIKMPVTDSAISALNHIVDNFEDIISNKIVYDINPELIKDFIKVYTLFNSNSLPVKVILKDNTFAYGYVIYSDSTFIVITPNRLYNKTEHNFKILNYYDIYSISGVDYPITDASKELFNENNGSILKSSVFTNNLDKNVTPPEVISYINEHPEHANQQIRHSYIDFDSLYIKKMMLSVCGTFQRFNVQGMQIILSNIEQYGLNLFSFKNYYSLGLNFDYRITKKIKLELGYNYESINFTFGKDVTTTQLLGNALNFNLFYNIWQSKLFNFQRKQIFVDVFGGIQIHRFNYANYNYYVVNVHSFLDTEIKDYDIIKKLRLSYKAGLNIHFKLLQSSFIYFSGFVHYHDNYGLVSYDNKLYTRYINYIISYGISCGFGIEF